MALASRERIEELLVAVRQCTNSSCADLMRRRDDTVSTDSFSQGKTLDAPFPFTGAARRSDTEDCNADTSSGKSDSSLSNAATAESSSSAKRGESTNEAGIGRELPQQADGNVLGSKEALAGGSRDRTRPSTRKETKATETATSTTASTEGPSTAPRPRPRLPRKKQPSSVVPPELAALFRTPLLVPRHLDPPVAGIAAAAVAAGGTSRIKPGTGVLSSDR